MNPPPDRANSVDFRDVRILAAPEGSAVNATELARLRTHAVPPFSPERVEQLGRLSQRIMQHPDLRHDAASVAAAFWLRPANLSRMIGAWRRNAGSNVELVAAGLVFHVAPANVDTMFLYSWALAYVTGNASMVRLSSERPGISAGLLECIASGMKSAPAAWKGNLFVTHPHNDSLTAAFSAVCDQRVVWGGDETVRRLRLVPLHPHAGERSFATKFSFAVLPAERFLTASRAARTDLIRRVLTDLTPFAQQACSSPHLIYWLGSETAARAALQVFAEVLGGQQNGVALPLAVERLVAVFEAAADGGAWQRGVFTPALWNLVADPGADAHGGPGFGVLRHAVLPCLDALAQRCSPADQTVGHWGLDGDEVRTLARVCGRAGVDRVVPVGRALEFSPVWDGHDLIGDFVRRVWIAE